MTTTIPAVINDQPMAPLAPLDITQTQAAMTAYQQGLHSLLDDGDWQEFRQGGEIQRFVKRSGWRKIATWFAINLEVRTIDVDRDDKDAPVRARAIVRATAPNGRFAEGDGAASTTERRFSKPEHDLSATAATRAMNRAISNLVGLGAVSAEEIEAPEPITEAPAPWGPLAAQEQENEAAQLITQLHPTVSGLALIMKFEEQLGTTSLPEAAYRMVKAIAWGLSDAGQTVVANVSYDNPRATDATYPLD